MHIDREREAPVDLNELVAILVAVLRADGHLSNVLTHVGRGNWRSIEAAIGAILAPRTRPSHLDPVARDVLALICDGRGVTGPMMQAIFFAIVEREISPYQAKRLKSKMRRLRRNAIGLDLPPQEQPRRTEFELSDQACPRERAGVADYAGPVGNPTGSAQSEATSKSRAPAVEFGSDGISIDAALIADGLGLDPASVSPGMGRGEITAVCERGIDADDGLYRLTFLRTGHRVRLIVDLDGQVRQRSSIAFGKTAEMSHSLSP